MPLATVQSATVNRFWPKVEIGQPNQCWPFIGAVNRHGYGRFGMGQEVVNAHRIVCEQFYGAPREGDQARHLCGNRVCCNPTHLAWGSQSQNEMDKVLHGRSNRGARHGMAKLTQEQVERILQSNKTQTALAAEFNVSQTTIWEIRSGRTWAWLERG